MKNGKQMERQFVCPIKFGHDIFVVLNKVSFMGPSEFSRLLSLCMGFHDFARNVDQVDLMPWEEKLVITYVVVELIYAVSL